MEDKEKQDKKELNIKVNISSIKSKQSLILSTCKGTRTESNAFSE